MYKVGFISLGCSKNLVDTEMMIGVMKKDGYEIVNDPAKADIIVINTCGFITSAKEEAINTILEMAQYKEEQCKYLIVTGCLVTRYKAELEKELPEVDAFIGSDEYDNFAKILDKVIEKSNIKSNMDFMNRVISTPSYMAYLKIAEGCSNRCTYCAIPYIKGPYVSRKMEDILAEAQQLRNNGVKEIVVIAQDTTKYGVDLYGQSTLPQLLDSIAKMGFDWVRTLYTYPESITKELIDVIKSHDNICNYFDIPIQHISDTVLKRMGRRGGSKAIKDSIELIHKELPDAIIRTTLIVGFPGESKEDFEELYQFVNDTHFDRLGVFAYSKEDNTPAENLDGHLPERTKVSRRNKIMKLQQQISLENNQKRIGKEYMMLVESVYNNKVYGRTYMDVADIDGIIICSTNKKVNVGDFVKIKITDVNEYDLKGEII